MVRKALVVGFVPVLLSFLVVGTVWAANSAKPGDWLYSADRIIEDMQLAWASTQGNKALAEVYFSLADERLDELQLLSLGHQSAFLPSISWAYASEDGQDTDLDGMIGKCVDDYETALVQTMANLEAAQLSGERVEDLLSRVTAATLEHEQILTRIHITIRTSSQKYIERAIQIGILKHEEALDALPATIQQDVQDSVDEHRQEVIDRLEEVQATIDEQRQAAEQKLGQAQASVEEQQQEAAQIIDATQDRVKEEQREAEEQMEEIQEMLEDFQIKDYQEDVQDFIEGQTEELPDVIEEQHDLLEEQQEDFEDRMEDLQDDIEKLNDMNRDTRLDLPDWDPNDFSDTSEIYEFQQSTFEQDTSSYSHRTVVRNGETVIDTEINVDEHTETTK